MKHRFMKLVSTCLSVIMLAALAAACGPTTEGQSPGKNEITDQLGRKVSLATTTPQRIISLAPSNTETLYALGLGDRIAGVTEYDNYPPEAQDKPKVGGFSDTNIEVVVAMEPDLVLAAEIHGSKIIPQLEARGLTVVALNPKTLDEVLDAITLVGKITSQEKEAGDLTKDMQKRIKSVTDKTGRLTEEQKPRVFYVVWHDPLMTAGSGTFIDELISKAGGANIAGDLSDYADISLEAVVAADPQIMVAGVGMGTGEDLPLQFLKTESRLGDTEARRSARIYPIDTDIVGRAGPRITDALEEFARIIHPEIFK
ncbi:MAG: hypothetical protein A2Z29_06765 [Chloroflexi bacterium RBG_16_56_11]|nr:MAG: hypothetical protein A2Z29_06765 [Chloroflexi bacterium RBG_16_56_11]